MLGLEHVRARRRGEKLTLTPLSASERERALSVAAQLLEVTQASLGCARDEVVAAWQSVPREAKDAPIVEGLTKLVEELCDFGAAVTLDPRELRRQVFEEASRARRATAVGEPLERTAVLHTVASRLGVTVEQLDDALYADLRSAERLGAVEPATAVMLLERYERGQLQGALLRAVRVSLLVRCSRPEGYRRLFHALKFRRLLHRIEALSEGRYRVEVDGPFSLFESVTKYGLQLALLVPALQECDEVELEAELRWGKERKPVVLQHTLRGEGLSAALELRDEVQVLLDRLEASPSPWRARACAELLELPGVGLCVPDLVLEREGRPLVYLEVMGFWSRDAVWKRVELVEAGLGARVLFAVSDRLRVSEAVLEDDLAGLYVYKGSMSPRAILSRVEQLGSATSLDTAARPRATAPRRARAAAKATASARGSGD